MKLAVVLKMTHHIVDYVINGRNSQCLLFFWSLPMEGDAICDCKKKKNQNNGCLFFSAQREQNKSEVKMQSFSPQIPFRKKAIKSYRSVCESREDAATVIKKNTRDKSKFPWQIPGFVGVVFVPVAGDGAGWTRWVFTSVLIFSGRSYEDPEVETANRTRVVIT